MKNKRKFIVVATILFSLLFVTQGSIHADQPIITTFNQHGGA